MKYLSLALAVLIALFPLQVLAESTRVMLVAPAPGDDLKGKDVEIAVSYNTGSTDKVTCVELVVDGEEYARKYLDAPQTRGICSFLWDSTKYANGAHSIIIKIFCGDRLLGSVSGTANIGNKPIDVIPPTVKYYGIKSGDTVSGAREIKLVANDNSGDPPMVSVSVDKNLKMITNTPPYHFDWDTTRYRNGEHEIDAWGYDEAGNRGDAGSLRLIVKNEIKAAALAPLPANPPTPAPVEVERAEVAKPKVTNGEPIIPSISGGNIPASARSRESLPILSEIVPGVAAPLTAGNGVGKSSSLVVQRAVNALVNPLAQVTAKQPAKVTSPSSAVAQSRENTKADDVPSRESVEMALAEPSAVESPSMKSESGAHVSLPFARPANPAVAGNVRAYEMDETPAQSGAAALEPSGKSSEIIALLPKADTQSYIDPLDIPASTTIPNVKSPDLVMMAMRPSAMTFECPLVESSPTHPELPIMTPHRAPIRSANADIKDLQSGIESGMKTMTPSIPGSVRVAMAVKPSHSVSGKKMPKVVRGTVRMVLGENDVSLKPADKKDGIPMAAVRQIMEKLGALVVWDNETKTVTAYNHGVRLTMKVGEPKARLNGKNVKMRAPVTLEQSQALVDVKFLTKALKMELEYDPETGEFTLTSK